MKRVFTIFKRDKFGFSEEELVWQVEIGKVIFEVLVDILIIAIGIIAAIVTNSVQIKSRFGPVVETIIFLLIICLGMLIGLVGLTQLFKGHENARKQLEKYNKNN